MEYADLKAHYEESYGRSNAALNAAFTLVAKTLGTTFTPKPAAADIKDHVAFWHGVEVER